MIRQSAIRLAVLSGAALVLQGCVAAALPVVAGSLMATRDVVRESGEDKAAPSLVIPEVAATAEVAKSEPDPSVIVGDLPAAAERTIPLESTSDWQVTQMTELPAPSGTSGPPGTLQPGGFTAFTMYAAEQNALAPGEAQSALLADPGQLDGVRTRCGMAPLAVLIDLDPATGTVSLDGTGAASIALANQLESLRRQDVTIGWISDRLTVDADQLRARLADSGLDPMGEDTLLLMRTFGERKQERRREFGRDYCLVAIAGDTHSDFDELFDYIKDRSLAIRLDALQDAGWFITPTPLSIAPQTTTPNTTE